MLYKEWADIVIFNDCEHIRTREQQLDTSNALDLSWIKTGRDMLAWSSGGDRDTELRERGIRLTSDRVLFETDDQFETMEITDFGHVMIWTRKYVGTIHHPFGSIEKLRMLPRNPPQI